MMRGKKIFFVIPVFLALFFSVFSCSEGIFNFSEETGNISLYFEDSSSAGEDLSEVVFNLSNNKGDSIRKTYDISGGNNINCYTSRADTGDWQLLTTVYLADGTTAAEREDHFELSLAQTVIADLFYFSDGTNRGIDLNWETPVGGELQSIIRLDGLEVFQTSFHQAPNPPEIKTFNNTVIAWGGGFSTGINGITLRYPDDSIFELTGGARQVTGLAVEMMEDALVLSRQAYLSLGNYSLTLTDINGVETGIDSYIDYGFDPYDFSAVLLDTYDGGNEIYLNDGIEVDNYVKRNSDTAGCYIVYNVDKYDGTFINNGAGVIDVYPAPDTAETLWMSGVPVGIDAYVVLATVDADLSWTEINDAFALSNPNLLPERLPGWLYENFGDRVNFVGVSVLEYLY